MRWRERRREECVGPLPSLRTALRQLRVRVLDADTRVGLLAFEARATAIALLANAQDRRPVGDILMTLVRRLASAPLGADPRPMIYSALGRAEVLLG